MRATAGRTSAGPLRPLSAALLAGGFILGTAAGPGGPVLGGLIWAVATALGIMAGLLAFLVVADLLLSNGPDDDVVTRLAGGKVMVLFVVLGAVGMWMYLFMS